MYHGVAKIDRQVVEEGCLQDVDYLVSGLVFESVSGLVSDSVSGLVSGFVLGLVGSDRLASYCLDNLVLLVCASWPSEQRFPSRSAQTAARFETC